MCDPLRPSLLERPIVPVAIVCLAALLRLGYAYANQDDYQKGNGATLILPLARNMAAGNGFTLDGATPSTLYAPVYPGSLGLAIRVFGESWWPFALVHVAVGTLLVVMTWLSAREVFGARAAGLSALIVAAYPWFIAHGMSVSDTLICTLTLMILVFCCLRAMRTRKAIWILLSGMAFGLGALTRGSVVPLFPLLLFTTIRPRQGLRWSAGHTVLLLVGMVVPVTPWVVRNYRVCGRILISTHGGWPAIWGGNNEYAAYLLEHNISLDAVAWDPVLRESELSIPNYWYASPEEALAAAPRFKEATLRFWEENPHLVPRLVWLRAVGFWSVNYHPRDWRGNPIPPLKQWAHRLSYGPLLAAALIGALALGRRWRREHVFLVLVIALYFAPHLIVWGITRTRLPLDAVLSIFAGFGIVWILDKLSPIWTRNAARPQTANA